MSTGNRHKQIVIATVPLNGARDADDTSIVNNTPREVIYNEQDGSIQIQSQGEIESQIIGSVSTLFGSVEFADVNALAVAETGDIICAEAFPAGGIPDKAIFEMVTPFNYASPDTGIKILIKVVNTVTGNVLAKNQITWELLSTLEAGAKIAVEFNLGLYAVSDDALDVITTISFIDTGDGTPIDNPQNLTAGSVRHYGVNSNSTV